MITVYLNSLYNMLYGNNPLVVYWQTLPERFKTVWHIRRNREKVHAKIMHLEANLQSFETSIYTVNPKARHAKLDTYR